MKRTVPVVDAPPVTDIGLNTRELGPNGVPRGTTVTSVLSVIPLYTAVTVIGVMKAIGADVTVNVVLVEPEGTQIALLTLITAGQLLLRLTQAPPSGAGAVRAIVPWVEEPLTSVDGLKLNDAR